MRSKMRGRWQPDYAQSLGWPRLGIGLTLLFDVQSSGQCKLMTINGGLVTRLLSLLPGRRQTEMLH